MMQLFDSDNRILQILLKFILLRTVSPISSRLDRHYIMNLPIKKLQIHSWRSGLVTGTGLLCNENRQPFQKVAKKLFFG